MKQTNEIIIKLCKDESLVLFDFHSRINDKELKQIFDDQAEQKVLWVSEGHLEKQFVEPFQHDCKDTIEQARNKIRKA